jgi:AmmeMemoRadiSam system protein B
VTPRPAALAGTWYPSDESACRDAVASLLRRAPTADVDGPLLGGVVPHAGWDFSGPTAAAVYRALRDDHAIETIVVLGAVHRHRVDAAAVWTGDAWETPLGLLPVNVHLARAVLDAAGPSARADDRAHVAGENSIELQTALLRGILPQARFLPVMVPPSGETAVRFGRALAVACRDVADDVVVVASTDLTHYGYGGWSPAGTGAKALRWVREENDRRFLDLVTSLDAEAIVPEAATNLNACGAGATAAAVAAVREMGAAEGILLQYTTSHDVLPDYGDDRFVGYAGVVFR